ncbi:MAG: disulfide bond formation protein B [Pararhodobacter sp.]
MRDWSLAFIAALGSALMLAGALFFQYVIGLAPCELCIWQRWPHVVAFAIGLITFFFPQPGVMALGAMTMLVSAGLGIYHTGVERAWWQGPTTCSGTGDISSMNAEDLLNHIMAAPVVRCTDVAWEMFGLSMASWNAIISLALAAIWVVALRRS